MDGDMRCPKHDPDAARSTRQRGFSLLETLVALSLLGVAMLLTLALLMQEAPTLRRLGAHEEVLRVLEVTLEGIRAGRSVAQGRQPLDLSGLRAAEDTLAEDLRVWSERTNDSPHGLYELTLDARYRVGRDWYRRSIETRVWEPPP